MKIEFQTASWDVQNLEGDLQFLKKTIELPCEIQETVVANPEPRMPREMAIAFVGKEEVKTNIPIIEINPQYFNKDKEKRILVLLHEIIHCCQRVNELKIINEKYMINLAEQLNSIPQDYKKNHSQDEKFYTLLNSTRAIALFSSWIFEIWDEMYLKINHPDKFETKLEGTFEKIDQKINADTFKDFGDWEKYPVFINLVRAYYLEKITAGHNISKKFQDLCKRWKNKLKQVTDTNEYNELMKNLESLTRIEDYANSDTSAMEKSLDKLIEQMINDVKNRIF